MFVGLCRIFNKALVIPSGVIIIKNPVNNVLVLVENVSYTNKDKSLSSERFLYDKKSHLSMALRLESPPYCPKRWGLGLAGGSR